MGEISDVLGAIASLHARGEPMALATIVAVKGSTYRRPGARLLVPAHGDMVGNLSGGCLEGEVEGIARHVMADGEARLAAFDLTADDEVVWGWGLGCNGAIEVFIEPARQAAATAESLRAAIEQERAVALATVLASESSRVPVGARLIAHPDGSREGSTGDETADAVILDAARAALSDGVTHDRALETAAGGLRLFIEVLEPPLRLLVCGAGHDAVPLVVAASALGWRVVVMDDREAFLTQDRFPGASDFVVAPPEAAASAGRADARTYAVVMTHNFLRDRDYLRSLLASDVAYIGMLGPGARLERLLEDLGRAGVYATGDDRRKLHGPAGLDIGAEGPDEIAVAIVGEILATARGRAGGFLRDRSGPIHDREQHLAPT